MKNMKTEGGALHEETSHISAHSAEVLETLIAHYVAGTLPAPVRALVGAHLELKQESRAIAATLEASAGDAMEAIDPIALSDRDAMLKRVLSSAPMARPARQRPRCSVLPSSLVDFTGYTVKDIPWRTKMPGFREVTMPEMDGCHASIYWIRAGRAIPNHTHEGSEVTLVLDGGFADGLGHYLRGDVAAADETVDHRPVADDDGPCICFAVTTAPLKMTGSFRQLFSDIFGR